MHCGTNLGHVAPPKKNVPDAKGKKKTNDIHITLKVPDRQEEQASKAKSSCCPDTRKKGPASWVMFRVFLFN